MKGSLKCGGTFHYIFNNVCLDLGVVGGILD